MTDRAVLFGDHSAQLKHCSAQSSDSNEFGTAMSVATAADGVSTCPDNLPTTPGITPVYPSPPLRPALPTQSSVPVDSDHSQLASDRAECLSDTVKSPTHSSTASEQRNSTAPLSQQQQQPQQPQQQQQSVSSPVAPSTVDQCVSPVAAADGLTTLTNTTVDNCTGTQQPATTNAVTTATATTPSAVYTGGSGDGGCGGGESEDQSALSSGAVVAGATSTAVPAAATVSPSDTTNTAASAGVTTTTTSSSISSSSDSSRKCMSDTSSASSAGVAVADGRVFDRVQYLGYRPVTEPCSEPQVLHVIAALNGQWRSLLAPAATVDAGAGATRAPTISVTVPTTARGSVILSPVDSGCVENGVTEGLNGCDGDLVFPIEQIAFCALGGGDLTASAASAPAQPIGDDHLCVAFTCVAQLASGAARAAAADHSGDHTESPLSSVPSTSLYHCHTLRCRDYDTSSHMLQCFKLAFTRSPSVDTRVVARHTSHQLTVAIEMLEEDGKGGFSPVPCDGSGFKLRCNTQRRVSVCVSQTYSSTAAAAGRPTAAAAGGRAPLVIERCFGLLLAPGRNVKHGDMTLLEMTSMGPCPSGGDDDAGGGGSSSSYSATAMWDAADPSLQLFNHETPKDLPLLISLAVDMIIRGIHEPVRFVIECRVRIYPHSERFWYFSSKKLINRFIMVLDKDDEGHLRVQRLENAGPVAPPQLHSRLQLSLAALGGAGSHALSGALYSRRVHALPSPLATVSQPHSLVAPLTPDEDSDSDEPLPSGSGEVSKDCDVTELDRWGEILSRWRKNMQQRPRGLNGLVKHGVPEALRGQVWQLLAGCHDDTEILDAYKTLIAKDCQWESTIERDISRTFTGHDHFRERGGVGQDALFKLSKAYAVYDSEVGYCQGLSFMEAALLLHMPEEQAFCVLVHIMFRYRLRELFKDGFVELQKCFYQLDRLIEEQMPDLWTHLSTLGVESHMFASQWFLTLYTAKFPLYLVFHILDVFLLKDITWVFQVALALLQLSRRELLSMDFEGTLKYFRVSMPKRYRSGEHSRLLMKTALATKVKKLAKYEKEYVAIKEQESMAEDPVERLERESARLMAATVRLEAENDQLAMQLLEGRVTLRRKLDLSEEQCEKLSGEVASLTMKLRDAEDERNRLLTESSQVKELFKREVEKGDEETVKNTIALEEYKKLCSQLSERLERERQTTDAAIDILQSVVSGCERCSVISGQRAARVECDEVRRRLTPEHRKAGDGLAAAAGDDGQEALAARDRCIRELELELAQTKLAHVEVECRNQDLSHKLNAALSELAESKNTWLQKTLVSIKEAAKKD